MRRYLGIDLGEKRIGLAISDPTLTIAQPYKTLTFTGMKRLINELKGIVAEMNIHRVVIGFPLNMRGEFSQKTHETVKMFEKIKKGLAPVPVELYDERLTTVQAYATLHQMGKKPSREKDRVDQYAAMHLLQNYLDREKLRREKDA